MNKSIFAGRRNKEIAKKSKGQNPLLSHTLIVGFSTLLVLVVVTSLAVIKSDLQESIGFMESKQVCSLVENSVEIMFWEENYISLSNYTKGKITLKLPQKLADMNYRATFFGNNLTIETFGNIKIIDSCIMNFNATYSGSTGGGLTEILFKENSDRSRIIEMNRL
jgi:hypothetical protein